MWDWVPQYFPLYSYITYNIYYNRTVNFKMCIRKGYYFNNTKENETQKIFIRKLDQKPLYGISSFERKLES